MKVTMVIAALWSLGFFGPLFPVVATASESLSDVLARIRERKRLYDSQQLKNLLDGQPLDSEQTPVRDSATGAINITGETPRDKGISSFVSSVMSLRASLEAAQSAHQIAAQKLQDRDSTMRKVVIDLMRVDLPRSTWAPVRVEFAINDGSPSLFADLPAFDRDDEPMSLARTVLPVGEHRVLLRGVAAAVSKRSDGVGIVQLQDALAFEYQGAIVVHKADKAAVDGYQTVRFMLKKSDAGLNVVLQEPQGGSRAAPELGEKSQE